MNAAYSMAFQALGYPWASKIVSLGAITGIVTSLLLALLGQARIFMVLGREHFLPEWIVSSQLQNSTIVPYALVCLQTNI